MVLVPVSFKFALRNDLILLNALVSTISTCSLKTKLEKMGVSILANFNFMKLMLHSFAMLQTSNSNADLTILSVLSCISFSKNDSDSKFDVNRTLSSNARHISHMDPARFAYRSLCGGRDCLKDTVQIAFCGVPNC